MHAILADVETAAITPQLRATLRLIGKLTRAYDTVGPDDVAMVRAAGVSTTALHDALDITFAFNIITRIADALGFYCGPDEAFEMSATRLLKHGYK